MAFSWLLLLLITATLHATNGVGEAKIGIGVCYGLNGDNLPSPNDVVGLYSKYGIGKMRIFNPNPTVLNALRGSGIELTLGVADEDIPRLASSVDAADSWFAHNVQPYLNDITVPYIAVGNEVVPGEFSASLVAAMQNVQTVLRNRNLMGMRATTVVHGAVLSNSYPPSATVFSDRARDTMSRILQFLSAHGAPLLINVYPYFAYASSPLHQRLDYALFTATGTVVQDRNLSYSNLFDAMADSYIWAMEKVGVSNVDIVVSESGWPHAGNGNLTTPELAFTYNKNFMLHVLHGGTPKRPGSYVEGFIFAMFDEDQKAAGAEQNWGLFKPNMRPNYNIFA
ncbi:hypothetical protein Nepgr_015596 [Nepenthes gracilis]|uniref:Glucan endo-1,3-beta-D-glucosidase n=1 Tax=Nepenthes gracilis TaxID=150966 RepID=A0AAD3XRP7_NEPGR|nr:hypothetical protein Nepgr_015596 [Nepenthes gracilis]